LEFLFLTANAALTHHVAFNLKRFMASLLWSVMGAALCTPNEDF